MSEVFVLNSNWSINEKGPALSGRESTLVLYRDKVGRISFFSDDIGGRLLDGLMEGWCTYTDGGGVLIYQNSCSRESFLSSVYARGRICFFNPDPYFMEDVASTVQYKLLEKKRALYLRHGKIPPLPVRPVVDVIFSGERLSSCQEEWIYSHCAGYCIWRCVVGAEHVPIIFGEKRKLLKQWLEKFCDREEISLTEAAEFDGLLNW